MAEIIRNQAEKMLQPEPARNAITTPEAVVYDEQVVFADAEDNTLRPRTLEDYLGQESLKEKLHITLEAARQRREPLDHVLLYGPPGLGKTTMAMILATEMQAPLVVTAAPALERPRDIVGFLMTLEPNTVLFIDEIHRLNKVTEEILYPAMEDFTLIRTIGKGPTAKTITVPLPPFTLVGATTKAGSLSNPLRDRFGLVHRLNYYTHGELQEILTRSAVILGMTLTDDAALTIGQRSRGTPRIANRLLKRVRDVVQVRYPGARDITREYALEALTLYDIDAHGLGDTDRRLLTALLERFGGGPVGLESLAVSIGEDVRTVEDIYEPFLLQSGFIQRTPRGRMITPYALQHLFPNVPLPAGLQLPLLSPEN